VFVDLVPVRQPSLVSDAIIHVLEGRTRGHVSPPVSLVEAVHDQRLLLVLDNFEQVLTAAPSIAELVATCPHVTVLITSRAALRLRWEHEFPVDPLDLPGPRFAGDLAGLARNPAAALFVQRAQAVRPGFALDADNAQDIASICLRVQGMPLAIELAAARVRIMSPRELFERLMQTGASPTLDLLSGGMGDLPERQRSLRDTIAWSYDLLSPSEQVVFRRLSIFGGGWTLDAAEAVCGVSLDGTGVDAATGSGGIAARDVLDALLSLAEKSLLVQLSGTDGEPRFTMQEAMQEFGHERLAACDEYTALRQAHAVHHLAFVRSTARGLTGPGQSFAVHRLEQEHHNLRTALEWSLTDGDSEVALRLCASLTTFWYIRGHYREGREWCARALAAAPDGSPKARAAVLHGAASLADIQHDHAEARSLIEQSVAAWRAAGSGRGLAGSLSLLGMLARHEGDRELASGSCTEALDIYETSPDPWGERLALGVLGWLAEDDGDHELAQQLLEASLDKAREGRSPTDIALQLNNLGIVALRCGDVAASRARHREALELTRDVDAREPMACALEGLGAVAEREGDPRRAAWLSGAATALRVAISSPRIAQFAQEHDRLSLLLGTALGEDLVAAIADEGAAAPLEDVLAAALSIDETADAGQRQPPGTGQRGDAPLAITGVDLTVRQVEYLRLLAEGYTNRAIAGALVVSETAVEQMLVRLYVKIGARNRAEAIRYTYEQGLVELRHHET
jgi:non-specific serine/threonine protein kinase